MTIRFPLIGVGCRSVSAADPRRPALHGRVGSHGADALQHHTARSDTGGRSPRARGRGCPGAGSGAHLWRRTRSRQRGRTGSEPARPTCAASRRHGPSPGANGDGADDGEADPDVGDGAQRLTARRPGDGDLAAREPQAPRDGVVPVEQPQVSIDGDLDAADDMALDDPELEERLARAGAARPANSTAAPIRALSAGRRARRQLSPVSDDRNGHQRLRQRLSLGVEPQIRHVRRRDGGGDADVELAPARARIPRPERAHLSSGILDRERQPLRRAGARPARHFPAHQHRRRRLL